MKEILPDDEYWKWYAHREYEKRKDKYKVRYQKKKEEDLQEFLALIDEVWPDTEEVDWDEYYKEKFECDDKIKK